MRRIATVLLPLLCLAACVTEEAPATNTPSAFVRAATAPKSSLTALTWILGRFRGEGTDGTAQEPFYERYSLLNDSTLMVQSFADSTWSKSDTSLYELRGDSLAAAKTAHYVASQVSADSVVFVPRRNMPNGFTWRRGDANSWTAVISPVPVGRAPIRAYRMVRMK